jgi:hypothetical protein
MQPTSSVGAIPGTITYAWPGFYASVVQWFDDLGPTGHSEFKGPVCAVSYAT